MDETDSTGSDAPVNETEAEQVVVEAQPHVHEHAPELPVPLSVFAANLSPRVVALKRGNRPVLHKGRHVMTATAGHADEIWLKLLKIDHSGEKHTPAEWNALINSYRDQPAYPGALKGFA